MVTAHPVENAVDERQIVRGFRRVSAGQSLTADRRYVDWIGYGGDGSKRPNEHRRHQNKKGSSHKKAPGQRPRCAG
jgi:hypothetical protein